MYNTVCVICALFFYFCIHHSMLTTKNLVPIHQHRVNSLYPFCLSHCPFPSGNHYSVLCIYMFVFIWFSLFIYFIYLIFIFHIWMKSYDICLFASDLFHLELTVKVHPCCHTRQDFVFFMIHQYSIVCLYIPHLLYPFIHWWVLRLFPYLGYCK